MKNTPKLYFPGLNGLRFIAFFMVFFSHEEHFVELLGGNYVDAYFIRKMGASGVNLFFVISGYLITQLLLIEKANYKAIDIKGFYVRRILRIWPLYYWIMVLTFFIIPCLVTDQMFVVHGIPAIRDIILFVFFLPFVHLGLYPLSYMAAVLWSIGVEEIYYLFWPWIIKFTKNINLNKLILILVGFLSVKAIVTYLPYKVNHYQIPLKHLSDAFSFLRVENMIIGSIMAYIVLYQPRLKAILMNKIILVISCFLLLYFLFTGFQPFYFGLNPIIEYMIDPVIFGTVCGIVVVNVTNNITLGNLLEGRLMYSLGQISYGLYVYHCIALFLVKRLLIDTLRMDGHGVAVHLIFLIGSFGLTVLMSHLSYYYFEAKFLLLKKRFTRVVSGNDARVARM